MKNKNIHSYTPDFKSDMKQNIPSKIKKDMKQYNTMTMRTSLQNKGKIKTKFKWNTKADTQINLIKKINQFKRNFAHNNLKNYWSDGTTVILFFFFEENESMQLLISI